MGMKTFCTGKKAPIYGHGDALPWQKGLYIWAWGHFALAKQTLWAWRHFALAKKLPYMGMALLALAKEPLYMGMGTLCTCENASTYGHRDTLY